VDHEDGSLFEPAHRPAGASHEEPADDPGQGGPAGRPLSGSTAVPASTPPGGGFVGRFRSRLAGRSDDEDQPDRQPAGSGDATGSDGAPAAPRPVPAAGRDTPTGDPAPGLPQRLRPPVAAAAGTQDTPAGSSGPTGDVGPGRPPRRPTPPGGGPDAGDGHDSPTPGPRPPRRRSAPGSGTVLVAVFAVVMPLLWLARQPGPLAGDGTYTAAQEFASAWASDRLQDVEFDETSGPDLGPDRSEAVARETRRISAGMAAAGRAHPWSVTTAGQPREVAPDQRVQRLRVAWDLGGNRRWEYDTSVVLRRRGAVWLPVWSPTVLHPALVPGLVLATDRVPAPREQVIGAGEEVLMTNRSVVDVGIRPGDTGNRRRDTARDVAGMLGMDPDRLVETVMAADDADLVPVRTLPRRDCGRCDDLAKLAGVQVRYRTTQAAGPGTAAPLLGAVQPADEELRRIDPGRIVAGDLVGASGLQRAYDSWLAGTAGRQVRAVATPGSDVAPPVEPLHVTPPVPGRPLRITVDPGIQTAAETAVGGAKVPTTVVAVDVSNGDVTAVATGGTARPGDRGLSARVAPGWAFAMPAALALERAGTGAATPVECSPVLDVGGRRWSTDATPGRMTVQQAFIRGCRTAIAAVAGKVSPEQLTQAADLLGYGRADALGTQAFRGAVPGTADPLQHTAAVLGEGQVLASPLAVARASATVAGGRYVPSRLVLAPQPAPDGGAGGAAPALEPTQLATLRNLMTRSVIEKEGTAHALAGLGPVAAVAGWASYGPDGAAVRQVWCTGYRAGVAFAVLVEDTTSGPAAATAVAAAFLRSLPAA